MEGRGIHVTNNGRYECAKIREEMHSTTGRGMGVHRVCLAGSRIECWVTVRLDEPI